MKHVLMSSSIIKNIWIVFGVILLFTMSPFFQFFIYPFWYNIDGQSFPAFALLTARYVSTPFAFNRESLATVFMFALVIFNLFPLGLFLQGSLKIQNKFFFRILFSLVVITLFFDIFYFYNFWNYGLHAQGKKFLYDTVLKNILYFLSVGILIGFYCIKRNTVFLHVALLIFCITISTTAFPFLGRMSS